MQEEKKEGKQRRKDRQKNCCTGSSFECDIFFSQTHTHTGHFSVPKMRRTYVVCVCVCVCVCV